MRIEDVFVWKKCSGSFWEIFRLLIIYSDHGISDLEDGDLLPTWKLRKVGT